MTFTDFLLNSESRPLSYRAMWGKITATENRMGRQLLTRSIGGSSGGGSQLTPFAESLVQNRIATEADRLFEQEIIPRIWPTNDQQPE